MGVRSCRAAAVVLAFVMACGAVHAHGQVEMRLPPGAEPCLDADSVVVHLEGPPGVGAAAREIRQRALADARAIMRGFGGRTPVEGCADADAYVRLSLTGRWLDPQHYRGFGEDAYSLRSMLRVGPFEALQEAEPAGPDVLHLFGISDLHSEAETGVRAGEQLVRHARDAVVHLGEARTAAAGPAGWLGRVASGASSQWIVWGLVVVGVALTLRRRRTGQRP